MGYVLSAEHLIRLNFHPVRGPVYSGDWCWKVRASCSLFSRDPGPELRKELDRLRSVIATTYKLDISAEPAWTSETLHPFQLEAVQEVKSRVVSAICNMTTNRLNLIDVSLWEHGQGPRCPVLTLRHL